MASDGNSLAHTKWNCKYHIVFAPKYRRQIIYGKLKADIGKILRQLCEWKQVNIIEAEQSAAAPPYVGGDTAEDERVWLRGVSQGEKQPDHPRTTWEPKVQVWQSGVLVQGILRGHDREKHEAHSGVYPESAERRPNVRPDQAQGVRRPVYGSQVTSPSQAADRAKRHEAPLVKKGYARTRKTTGRAGGSPSKNPCLNQGRGGFFQSSAYKARQSMQKRKQQDPSIPSRRAF